MKINKLNLSYSGKSKSLYQTDDADYLIMEFRDDATAFNGEKKAKLVRKGQINNKFNAFIMTYLASKNIANQFVSLFSDTESIVRHLEMIPLECVIRNRTAGNLAKRLGKKEGIILNPPIFEFFFKDDQNNDPVVNDSIIRAFNWASETEINHLKTYTYQINQLLQPLFLDADLVLVDFKLEFGRLKGNIYLGDEFTPDSCRIWDLKTHEKLDKDRFRRDLGKVIESYEVAAQRLGVPLGEVPKRS